jgi:hypothetical protein
MSRSLPCAIYLQMTHAQCAVGNNFAVGLESLPCACFRRVPSIYRCPVPSLPWVDTLPWASNLALCRAVVYAVCQDSAKTQSRLPDRHPSITVCRRVSPLPCASTRQRTFGSFAVSKHTAKSQFFLFFDFIYRNPCT